MTSEAREAEQAEVCIAHKGGSGRRDRDDWRDRSDKEYSRRIRKIETGSMSENVIEIETNDNENDIVVVI